MKKSAMIGVKTICGAIAAAALSALLNAPASAQGLDLNPDQSRRLTPEEKERLKAIDEEYKSAIKKVPDKPKAADDPWASMRSTPATTTKQR